MPLLRRKRYRTTCRPLLLLLSSPLLLLPSLPLLLHHPLLLLRRKRLRRTFCLQIAIGTTGPTTTGTTTLTTGITTLATGTTTLTTGAAMGLATGITSLGHWLPLME